MYIHVNTSRNLIGQNVTTMVQCMIYAISDAALYEEVCVIYYIADDDCSFQKFFYVLKCSSVQHHTRDKCEVEMSMGGQIRLATNLGYMLMTVIGIRDEYEGNKQLLMIP